MTDRAAGPSLWRHPLVAAAQQRTRRHPDPLSLFPSTPLFSLSLCGGQKSRRNVPRFGQNACSARPGSTSLEPVRRRRLKKKRKKPKQFFSTRSLQYRFSSAALLTCASLFVTSETTWCVSPPHSSRTPLAASIVTRLTVIRFIQCQVFAPVGLDLRSGENKTNQKHWCRRPLLIFSGRSPLRKFPPAASDACVRCRAATI